MEAKRQARRTPINGYRNILSVKGKEPGYEYRWVNDKDSRIDEFRENGWDVVTDSKIKVGDKRVANPTSEGTPVTKAVGGGTTAYLMRIKSEWFKEDQAQKQIAIDELEASIKADAKKRSDYGKVEFTRD